MIQRLKIVTPDNQLGQGSIISLEWGCMTLVFLFMLNHAWQMLLPITITGTITIAATIFILSTGIGAIWTALVRRKLHIPLWWHFVAFDVAFVWGATPRVAHLILG
jgi:hypothetical protein